MINIYYHLLYFNKWQSLDTRKVTLINITLWKRESITWIFFLHHPFFFFGDINSLQHLTLHKHNIRLSQYWLTDTIAVVTETKWSCPANPSIYTHHFEETGRIGMLCSCLKKLSGSTLLFTFTNLSKLSLKYLFPQELACTKFVWLFIPKSRSL